MHILVIPSEHLLVDRYPFGGIFQFEQARALARAGHKIGIISVGFISLRYIFRSYKYTSHEVIDSIAIYRKFSRSIILERFARPNNSFKRYSNQFLSIYSKYEKTYGRPDVIHAHNFLYAGAIAEDLSRKYGIPFVLTEHSSAFARGLVPNSYNAALKQIVSSATALTCVSSNFRELLQNRFHEKFEVLSNIVDTLFFMSEFLNYDSDNFVFLAVGSLDSNKNHQILLRAFAAEFKGKLIYLKIIGDGPLRSTLEDLAEQLGIFNQVFFMGNLSRIQVSEEMRKAHCFVHPSNYETFGVVLIEAMASGLPLIATKCGGPEDIVNQGNGLLTSVGDQVQLQDAMRCMINTLDKYDRYALRAEAQSRFGDCSFVKNAVSLYTKAIKNDCRY